MNFLGQVAAVGIALSTLLVGVSIVLRLRRAKGVERQQLKWFAYAASVMSLIGVINVVAGSVGPPGKGFKPFQFFTFAIWIAIPFTVGIAILRYRLFDIDILIRRTLIYGALTATLALVYFATVVLLEQLFRALTGQRQSEIVIVLSTLAIAALSAPLRRRIQEVIDRRFYRRKYDATKVLAAFSTTVRDEVDLRRLTAGLLGAAGETMQPTSMSLWLKATAEDRRQTERKDEF